MTNPELDRLAATLSEAQRAAIVGASDMMSSHGGFAFLTVQHVGEPWPEGIAQFLTISTDRLTPLGLALRNHLKRPTQTDTCEQAPAGSGLKASDGGDDGTV